jgi:hypothetical protein
MGHGMAMAAAAACRSRGPEQNCYASSAGEGKTGDANGSKDDSTKAMNVSPPAVFNTRSEAENASRLAKGTASGNDGTVPPPAASCFDDYVKANLRQTVFGTGPYTTGHMGLQDRGDAKGNLSVWAVEPPGAEMATITITCFITITNRADVCITIGPSSLLPGPRTASTRTTRRRTS